MYSQGKRCLSALRARQHNSSTSTFVKQDNRPASKPRTEENDLLKMQLPRQSNATHVVSGSKLLRRNPKTKVGQDSRPVLKPRTKENNADEMSFTASEKCALNSEWLKHISNKTSNGSGDNKSSNAKKEGETDMAGETIIDAIEKCKKWLCNEDFANEMCESSAQKRERGSSTTGNTPSTPKQSNNLQTLSLGSDKPPTSSSSKKREIARRNLNLNGFGTPNKSNKLQIPSSEGGTPQIVSSARKRERECSTSGNTPSTPKQSNNLKSPSLECEKPPTGSSSKKRERSSSRNLNRNSFGTPNKSNKLQILSSEGGTPQIVSSARKRERECSSSGNTQSIPKQSNSLKTLSPGSDKPPRGSSMKKKREKGCNGNTASSSQRKRMLLSSFDSEIPQLANNILTPEEVHIEINDDVTPEQPVTAKPANFLKQQVRNPPLSSFNPGASVRKKLFYTGQNESEIQGVENVLIIPLDEPVEEANIEVGELFEEEEEQEGQKEPNEEPKSKKKKRTNAVSNSPATKKRKLKPSAWKANQAKLAYNSGLPHISLRGKQIAGRKIKDGCDNKCRKKCSTLISRERRQELFEKYWGLQDKMLQWYFVSKLVQSVSIKKRKADLGTMEPYRTSNYEYNLSDNDGNSISVCQKMFVDTFDISVRVVRTAVSKNSPDKRGKHAHHKKLSPALVSSVKNHIKSFPMVPSHYCRADTNRKYLDEHLNVSKMHRMYLIGRNVKDSETASLRQYRDIFNTYFNLSFFKPKKDQCSECADWKLTEENAESYNLHQSSKAFVRELKKTDKIISRDSSQGSNRRVLTCDMQKVLYCPKSELGDFYYKRKLSVYNFTIFDCTTKEGNMYVWDQTCGKKGSDETSSFLQLYIESLISKGVTHITIYSDSCGGQNKNQFLFTMYYALAMKHNLTIIHRYLEKGHTQMECDSVHARVENKIKKEEIFVPGQYYGFMRTAKVKKPVYKVHEVKQKDIFNYRDLAQYLTWDKIPISKIREIIFDPTPGNIQFRVEWEQPLRDVSILVKKVGRRINWKTVKPALSYSGKFGLPPKLVQDIKWYLKKGHIPPAYVPLYMQWTEAPQVQGEEEEDENDVPTEIVPQADKVNEIMDRDYEDVELENANPFQPRIEENQDEDARSAYNDSDSSDSDE